MEKAKKTEKEILQATDLRIRKSADKIRKENQAQNEHYSSRRQTETGRWILMEGD